MSIVLKLSVILTVRCFCQSNGMIEWDGSSLNLFSVCIRSNRLRNCDVEFFALEFRIKVLVLLTHRNGFWLFANFGKKYQEVPHSTSSKMRLILQQKKTAFHFLTINYRSVCFVSDHFVPLWQQQNGAQ